MHLSASQKRTADHAAPADWRAYYEWEAGHKRFLPGEEPSEEMRVEFVERLLRGVSFQSALDAGCGNGYLASRLAGRAERAWATDLSLRRLHDGSRLFPKVSFTRAAICEQPFPERCFDLVSAVEVIEHLETPERAMNELKRLTRRYVVITVPYRGTLQLLHCPHCHQSYYHDGHLQSFNEERLAGMVRAAGLRILKLESYTPYYPPKGLAGRLPRPVSAFLRRILEALRLKEPVRPKYLGVLAERTA